MEHLTVKATTTTTDQELGTFTALVSAWTADREEDTITSGVRSVGRGLEGERQDAAAAP